MVGSETSTRNWSTAPIRSFARTPVAWDKVAGDHYQVSILKWIPRALTTHLLPDWGGCPVKNTQQRQYPNQNLPFFRADAQSVAKIEPPPPCAEVTEVGDVLYVPAAETTAVLYDFTLVLGVRRAEAMRISRPCKFKQSHAPVMLCISVHACNYP